MNLNELAQAITAATDGVRIDGPHNAGWHGVEITVGSRLGAGRIISVSGDGVARWVTRPAGASMSVRHRRLPADVEAAAETVIGLVYAE